MTAISKQRLEQQLGQPIPMDGLRSAEKRQKRCEKVKAFGRAMNAGICSCCGSTGSIEVHHIQPLIFGGPDEPTNVVPLCSECHKFAPDDWKQFIAYQRIGGQLGPKVARQAKRLAYEAKAAGDSLWTVNSLMRAAAQLEEACVLQDAEALRNILNEVRTITWGVVPLAGFVGQALQEVRNYVEAGRPESIWGPPLEQGETEASHSRRLSELSDSGIPPERLEGAEKIRDEIQLLRRLWSEADEKGDSDQAAHFMQLCSERTALWRQHRCPIFLIVDRARRENMNGYRRQLSIIKWARGLHPSLPSVPPVLSQSKWRDEDAIVAEMDEWDDRLSTLWPLVNEGPMPRDVWRMYYNAWLAIESLIDFLSIEKEWRIEPPCSAA